MRSTDNAKINELLWSVGWSKTGERGYNDGKCHYQDPFRYS